MSSFSINEDLDNGAIKGFLGLEEKRKVKRDEGKEGERRKATADSNNSAENTSKSDSSRVIGDRGKIWEERDLVGPRRKAKRWAR